MSAIGRRAWCRTAYLPDEESFYLNLRMTRPSAFDYSLFLYEAELNSFNQVVGSAARPRLHGV